MTDAARSLNRLAKWRLVLAGWQLGAVDEHGPECAAVRDILALHVQEGRGCVLCSPQEGRWPCTTRLICEEVLS